MTTTSLVPTAVVSQSNALPPNAMTSTSLADCPSCQKERYDHLMDDTESSFWKRHEIDGRPPYSRMEKIIAGGSVVILLATAIMLSRTKKKGLGDGYSKSLRDGRYGKDLGDGYNSKTLGDNYGQSLSDGKARTKKRRSKR